jgi:hypothetical protein
MVSKMTLEEKVRSHSQETLSDSGTDRYNLSCRTTSPTESVALRMDALETSRPFLVWDSPACVFKMQDKASVIPMLLTVTRVVFTSVLGESRNYSGMTRASFLTRVLL